FLPLLLHNKNRNHLDVVAAGKSVPNAKEFFSMLLTFLMTVFAWIFFRAENIQHAMSYISDLFSGLASKSSYVETMNLLSWQIGYGIPLVIVLFFSLEWLGRENQYAISHLGNTWKRPMRHALYYALIFAIFWFGGKEQQFIYFQF
ncbi:MAG TPA: MBOAT family protein, partial [Bacteroidia bacterium]|nr:MBOAT family protein [Bacteroidia bacterium]